MWRWIAGGLVGIQVIRLVYKHKLRRIVRVHLGLAYSDYNGNIVLLPKEADDVVLMRRTDFQHMHDEHNQALKRATAWQN